MRSITRLSKRILSDGNAGRCATSFLKLIFEFLDIRTACTRKLTVEKRMDRDYEIEFRNVSFRYRKRNICLRNVSIKFRIGERLAVVGRNGSRKPLSSSCFAVLRPDGGEILLSGIDIRKYDYAEYMSLLIVFQDFRLFAYGSVKMWPQERITTKTPSNCQSTRGSGNG